MGLPKKSPSSNGSETSGFHLLRLSKGKPDWKFSVISTGHFGVGNRESKNSMTPDSKSINISGI